MSSAERYREFVSERLSAAAVEIFTVFERTLVRYEEQMDGQHRLQGLTGRPRRRFHGAASGTVRLRRAPSASVGPPDGGPQLGWEEPGVCGGSDLLRGPREDAAPLLLDWLQTLAEVEQLFDELMQEKLQIEAALSRMPAAGSRVTLQTRLDEVALEERLERLDLELGSLRMTLKRFHVVRASANT